MHHVFKGKIIEESFYAHSGYDGYFGSSKDPFIDSRKSTKEYIFVKEFNSNQEFTVDETVVLNNQDVTIEEAIYNVDLNCTVYHTSLVLKTVKNEESLVNAYKDLEKKLKKLIDIGREDVKGLESKIDKFYKEAAKNSRKWYQFWK